jgi:hypothetical protein
MRLESSLRERCLEAYDAIDSAPYGPQRRAAWAAYVLVTYADKVLDASPAFARQAYTLAASCLEPGAIAPRALPRWGPGTRSEAQLHGMQDTLEVAYTFLAYELRDPARLADIDACRTKVAQLWVARPTPDLRGGIADALLSGLDRAYALGLELAG